MKKKYCIFLFVLLIAFVSCNTKSNKNSDLNVIDISKNYPKKEISIQSIADIEYVALETTDDVLLGAISQITHLSDKYIVIYEMREGDIFIFDRKGKIVSYFNHKGPSSNEYNFLMNTLFDEKNEEIFAFDINNRILVYSITGKYKRTLNTSEDLQISAYNFDDEMFLVYDTKGLLQNEYSKQPYLLMSKKDGNIIFTFDITLSERYSNRHRIQTEVNGQTTMMNYMISHNNISQYRQDYVVSDMSSDTIYRLTKEKDLVPLIARKPSVHSSDPRIVLEAFLVSNQFIHLTKTTLDFSAARNLTAQGGFQVPSTDLFFDIKTGETFEVTYINEDDLSGNVRRLGNTLLQIHRLKTASEEKKLKGDLEKIVSTLDEEDNPIVMIMNFK